MKKLHQELIDQIVGWSEYGLHAEKINEHQTAIFCLAVIKELTALVMFLGDD